MRGHVAKKGNRWYVVVDAGRDPATNRRRQKWHSGYATRAEAERALPRIVGRLYDGTYVEPDRVTVEQYLTLEWIPAVRASLRPSTVALYETIIGAYIVPRIGQERLQSLGPGRLNRLYADLLTNGRARDRKPLGAVTTRKVHTLLHRALRDAERWGRITRNPAAVAEPPRIARTELKAWGTGELRAFLTRVEGDRLEGLWWLLATTGLRRAESLGLRWSDLTLGESDAARVTIHQTLGYVGTKAMFSEPKTARSRRLVTLAPETVAALKAHRARQAQDKLSMGVGYADQGLVFASVAGAPLNPSTVSRSFDAIVKAAELPRITLHGLRHTWATLALLDGIPAKVVAEVLGHSSTRVTEDVYQHVTPGMQADATARVVALL